MAETDREKDEHSTVVIRKRLIRRELIIVIPTT